MVGLGNPGSRYQNTRHNLGADAAVVLAARHGERLREDSRLRASVAEVRIGEHRLVVAVPMTWMNESGLAVANLVRRYSIESIESLLVLHDELDLPSGRVKVKVGGGLAGNNGLRSINQHLGTSDFTRIRIGVDKPPGGAAKGADWVLSKIPASQRPDFDIACERTADAVEMIAAGGPQHAMQKINAVAE